jgi:DNA invertase Pin-like site-specific DNA recombinase
MKAIGYCRVSTADQAREGVSLAAQAERIRAYATLRGLELVEIITDEGVSGTVPLNKRPGASALLAAVKAGKASEVIALKLDRLFRNTHDALGNLAEWDKREVGVHLIDMGGAAVDTRSAMGRMMLTMMAGFAQFERDLISERTAGAMQHMKRHRQAYSHTPLGYSREGDALVPDAAEGALLARIHAMRASGLSLHKVAAALNAEGIAGKNGGRFHACTIQAILKNPIQAAPAVAAEAA